VRAFVQLPKRYRHSTYIPYGMSGAIILLLYDLLHLKQLEKRVQEIKFSSKKSFI